MITSEYFKHSLSNLPNKAIPNRKIHALVNIVLFDMSVTHRTGVNVCS